MKGFDHVHADERAARRQFGGTDEDVAAPQGQALILELQRLRQAFEHDNRQDQRPPLRRPAQIFYVHNARRLDRSRQAIHMTAQRSRVFFNTRLQPSATDLRPCPAEAIAVANPFVRSKPETKSHVR